METYPPELEYEDLEAREADSFEYRRAALDRLRDRGLLSERERGGRVWFTIVHGLCGRISSAALNETD